MDKRVFDEALASLPPGMRAAKPFAALLLGSGWNQAAGGLDVVCEVPYSAIPGFGAATVVGHDGRLLLARTKRGGEVLEAIPNGEYDYFMREQKGVITAPRGYRGRRCHDC